jgi:hypothetical protein
MTTPIFAIRVRARPGVDAIRSLRAWLKIGLRTFGLKCVSAEQVEFKTDRSVTMDTRKYGSGFIKPDDVRDGPREEKIIHVFESEKYSRLVLELESGDQFTLNQTNVRVLQKSLWLRKRRVDRSRRRILAWPLQEPH